MAQAEPKEPKEVASLIGEDLDIAVAMAEGHPVRRSTIQYAGGVHEQWPGGNWEWIRRPSIAWEHGGPIIDRERMSVDFLDGEWCVWRPVNVAGDVTSDARLQDVTGRGPTLLVAAMRAYVASKLGANVCIP